jgi:uncharacterized Rossmann fold enzyme
MDYKEISRILGLNEREDRRARDVLDSLVGAFDEKLLKGLLKKKKVLVFGCGPSLKEDFLRLAGRLNDFVLVAVDGSIRLFMEEAVLPHIHVTDLDGDVAGTIEANRHGVATVVHAHGDNINRLREVVPKLSGKVFGTTQVEPTKKVLNFGGFTDGDRAVYLVEHYKPAVICLAGMDFGRKVGEYSGEYTLGKKLKKLKIGKKLLEELAGKTKTPIVNLTPGGVRLAGIPKKSAACQEPLVKDRWHVSHKECS